MVLLFAQLVPTFLVPALAGAGALAVAIPILIHILSKRPRKPEPWAAMRFLLAAYQKHKLRTRLEQWLLLAVRCLLVLLLGLALAGPILAAAGFARLTGSSRLAVLILDDSVTSGATDPSGQPRLTRLKQAADRWLASLHELDRVVVITAAKPGRFIVSPPGTAPSSVRNLLSDWQPNAAAADWASALRLAHQAVESAAPSAIQPVTLMLSDFSAGASRVNTPTPPVLSELQELGRRARLVMNQPAAAAENVQIVSLEPERRMVLAQSVGQGVNVQWVVRLRRFTADASRPISVTLRLNVPGATGQRQAARFETDQLEAELRVPTVVSEPGLLVAEAELEPAAAEHDRLTADNLRWSPVRVRQRLRVLLVGDEPQSETSLTPRKWLATALAPSVDRLGSPIEVQAVEPSGFGTPAVRLNQADVVMVLRPDQLGDGAWDQLRSWVAQGGLVWFVAPMEQGPALWPQKLSNTFGLDWPLGPEAVEPPQPLVLDAARPAPLELRRLSDLPELLRPIEVYRYWPVEKEVAADAVLLVARDGQPLLLGAAMPKGRGRVYLLTTALDPQWTNLPAKPLIVALVQEWVRSALDRLQPQQAYEPGDQPLLPPTWDQVAKLAAPDGQPLLLTQLPLSAEENNPPPGVAKRPIRPFDRPGPYRAETDALVVNVSADAADTRATDPQYLRNLLAAAGNWEIRPLDQLVETAPQQADRTDMTGPLLWAVLALALMETLLARYVSHAGAQRTQSVLTMESS